MARLGIHPVRALKDNYVYVVVDEDQAAAAVVDPGEAAPVEAELARLGVELRQIWCTHHHYDHVGGIAELVARRASVEVLASAYELEHGRVPGQTRGLGDGETFTWAGQTVTALHIPGHTLGHMALVVAGNVFPGDTLFGACCGRLFEGTPAQMQASLSRLRDLPGDTRIWCGHEYTLGCLRFAVTIEPGNAALAARHQRVAAEPTRPTVPLSMGEEKTTNPFLRWDAPEVRKWAGTNGDVDTFAAVRAAKDVWKG